MHPITRHLYNPATAINPAAPLGRPVQRSWLWRAVLHARGDEADVCRSVQVAVPVSQIALLQEGPADAVHEPVTQGTTGTRMLIIAVSSSNPCPAARPNLHLPLPLPHRTCPPDLPDRSAALADENGVGT